MQLSCVLKLYLKCHAYFAVFVCVIQLSFFVLSPAVGGGQWGLGVRGVNGSPSSQAERVCSSREN